MRCAGGGSARSALAAIAAAVAAAGGCGGIEARELTGRVRQTFQTLTADGERSDAVLQNYEVSFRNPITQSLSWQARLRALITGMDQEVGADTDSTLTEPFLEVVYEGLAWEASAGSRFTRIDPKGSRSAGLESRREDYFGHAAWFREDLPRLDWTGYRISLDTDAGTHQTEDRSLLTGSYSRGPGSLSLSMENRWLTNHRTDFTRDSIQLTGNGDLRGSFAGGRVSVGGQALVLEGHALERSPGATQVDVGRRPRSGLYAQDITPLLGLLGSAPALIDGDLAAPAADLSGDFRNVGVDLGFPEQVDTALVYLERRLLPGNEADYTWDVYASVDGDTWAPLAIGSATRFEPLLNRFEITFFAATTRFLKVVNTGFSRNEPPLAVTEIQVTGKELRTGRETITQSLQSGNVTVAWKASRVLDLSLNTFANRQSTGGDQPSRSDEDLNAILVGTLRPGRIATTTVRFQAINRSSSLGRPEADRIASVSFAAAPLPALDFSVTGTHRRETSRSLMLVQADSIELRGAARLARDTEASLDLGLLHQDEGTLDRETSRRRAQLSLVSTLRPGLFFSNNWSVERIRFRGTGAGVAPPRTDLDLRSRLSYRPTRVLGAAVEVLYQDIAGVDGFSRLYDLDWLPFAGGALQIQLTFRQDRRSFTGEVREESRVGARWSVNPRTLLELAWNVINAGPPDALIQQRVATVFLEHRF